MKHRILLLFLLIFDSLMTFSATQNTKENLISTLEKVNNYWQSLHSNPGNSFWDNAAYQTGNMEAYFITKNTKYLDYALKWAEQNEWKGAKGNDKTKWKFNYGETDDYVLFGDWQICFQTYIDLYNILPDERKIMRAKEVMNYEINTERSDYWWWSDGLFMVMPVMVKIYKLTGNQLYLQKLYNYYNYSKSIMYDADEKLFYRDAKYIFPKHKSVNGKKDFWARGNGWVFAGLAKVLKDLPENDNNRKFFEKQYTDFAKAIVNSQQKEGYWTRSMLDSAHAPGYETSGTAFFTYGLLWGINNGYLKCAKYKKAALKGWNYLSTIALQIDGKIGYIQPIGERAIPGQIVDKNSTANFGVGAFLLANCEMIRYIEKKKPN